MKKVFFTMVVIGIVFGLGVAAYAQEHSGDHHIMQSSMDNQKQDIDSAASEKAVNVGNKICPVSGEKVGQGGMEAVTYEYEGKIYNFCCSACIEEFRNNPEKYVQIVEEEKKNK